MHIPQQCLEHPQMQQLVANASYRSASALQFMKRHRPASRRTASYVVDAWSDMFRLELTVHGNGTMGARAACVTGTLDSKTFEDARDLEQVIWADRGVPAIIKTELGIDHVEKDLDASEVVKAYLDAIDLQVHAFCPGGYANWKLQMQHYLDYLARNRGCSLEMTSAMPAVTGIGTQGFQAFPSHEIHIVDDPDNIKPLTLTDEENQRRRWIDQQCRPQASRLRLIFPMTMMRESHAETFNSSATPPSEIRKLTMKTKLTVMLFAAAASLNLGSYVAYAQTQPAASPEFVQQLRAALRENPEIVLEAATAAQQRAEARQRAEQEQAVGPVRTELSAASTPGLVLGNPKGTFNVIEFLDYNCGFCKKSHGEVSARIAGDSNVRVVMMMRPILGPSSKTLARFALAADLQGKFSEVNSALLSGARNDASDTALEALSKSVGMDWARAKTDMGGKAVTDRLGVHEKFAERIRVSGTPFFITPTKVIPGAVTKDQLR